MFNQYTSTHCQHNIPAISCSLCNRTQPIEYNQFETQIKNLETQLKHKEGINKSLMHLILEQEKKIAELATKLTYANQTIENLNVEEPQKEQEPQYLYVYNDANRRESWMSPTFIHETYGWHYMGKVRVEK